ncbi:MAG TPA: M23 family metallopeptidase [Burkholderiales bacterium]|nr:M23 family metallopeptidase [Burkholderiales bacterium]
MNIILVSGNLDKSRIVTLSQPQIVMAVIALMLLMCVLGSVLYSVTMRYAVDVKNPYLQTLLSTLYQKEALKNQAQLRDSVNTLATKLGEMQARLMRLDAVGERLAKVAGVKLQDFNFAEIPGRGGAAPSSQLMHDMSLSELNRELDETTKWLNDRTDKLTIIDDALLVERLKKKAMPTVLPIAKGYFSSNFGSRIDPFNGRHTQHEGIDFVAPAGTAVQSAAGGAVVESVYHNDYGNMVEIDHGNGLITRYAHLSRRIVNAGDVVLKGQIIGELGSTGRSTGPHLHFEVRQHGAALNPKKFLELNG